MRICGNEPVAVRRGAVCIGSGRDFGHSMEANALVQQTPRGRFRYAARLAAAFAYQRAGRSSPRRALPTSSLSVCVCHWFSIRCAGDSAYRVGAPPPTGSGSTARRASRPHKRQRRGSPRRAFRISSPVCHWFSRPRAGDSAYCAGAPVADRLRPDSAPRISPRRAPYALLPPYRSSTSNENTPHCSRPQVSSSVSRTPHARASKSCTRRR